VFVDVGVDGVKYREGVVGGGEGVLLVAARLVECDVGLALELLVVFVVGAYVVLYRPHTTHCVPMCAVPHIGQGAVVVVVLVLGCAAVVLHTLLGDSTSTTSSSMGSSGE
jgi:hypothetical protein